MSSSFLTPPCCSTQILTCSPGHPGLGISTQKSASWANSHPFSPSPLSLLCFYRKVVTVSVLPPIKPHTGTNLIRLHHSLSKNVCGSLLASRMVLPSQHGLRGPSVPFPGPLPTCLLCSGQLDAASPKSSLCFLMSTEDLGGAEHH